MRILIGHHLWARPGGGEWLSACLVKAVRELGHEVAIASTTKIDFHKIKLWFNVDLAGCKTYYVVSRYVPYFGLYQRLLFWRAVRKGILDFRPDVVWVDDSAYKPLLELRRRHSFTLIEYIHFPFDAVFIYLGQKREVPKTLRDAFAAYYGRDIEEYYSKYFRSLFWKLYFKLWMKLYMRYARDNPFTSADLVLCNSRYIAKLCSDIWGRMPEVLYPPVDIEKFLICRNYDFESREDKVIMIGRISQEKKIEVVIEAISKSSTRPELVVVGGLTRSAIPYKTWLEDYARKLGVRLRLMVNAPQEVLLRELATSKIFVHACVGEHFGIAVVEAMAAGLPVIVHKSGGPWIDIVEEGRYGLGFETAEDLAEQIDKLITDEKEWRRYSELSTRRCKVFSYDKFRDRLAEILKKL